MRKFVFSKIIGTGLLALAVAACGSSGSDSNISSTPGNSGGGSDITLKVTALNTKQVAKVAQTSKAMDVMLALFAGKEAVAAAGNCATADAAKEFDLSGAGTSVCLTKAVVVYEEIEFEQEGVKNSDKAEFGPFVLDLIGSTAGIPESINLPVPDGTFNKIEFKIGDLDDRSGDGSIDDSPSSSDDTPKNITGAVATSAGLSGQSLVIEGIAHDGAGGTQAFTFKTNLEGKVELPFTTPSSGTLIVDGSTLITVIDMAPGFAKLSYAQITATTFGTASFTSSDTCGSVSDSSRTLACDIVKTIDLFGDDNSDGRADDSEHRSSNHGGGGLFDDSGNRD